jgi:hypothetical protein
MQLIAILTFFSIIQFFARIAAKESCPLVLGHRGAPGVYPEDTVILAQFYSILKNLFIRYPRLNLRILIFYKANLLFVLINGFLFEIRKRQENAADVSVL